MNNRRIMPLNVIRRRLYLDLEVQEAERRRRNGTVLEKDTVNQDEVIKQLLHTSFAEDSRHCRDDL